MGRRNARERRKERIRSRNDRLVEWWMKGTHTGHEIGKHYGIAIAQVQRIIYARTTKQQRDERAVRKHEYAVEQALRRRREPRIKAPCAWCGKRIGLYRRKFCSEQCVQDALNEWKRQQRKGGK